MSGHQTAALACKILGIYTVIQAAKYVPVAVNFTVGPRLFAIVSSVVPVLLLLSVGIILWARADRIAGFMINEEKQEGTESRLSGRELEVIGFSLIGLFVIVEGIPNLAMVILNYLLVGKVQFMNQGMTVHTKVALGVAILKIIIGVVLLFGSRGLVGIIRTARQAGVQNMENGD